MDTDKLLLKKEKSALLADLAFSMRVQAIRESDRAKIETILQKAIVRESDQLSGLRGIPLLYERLKSNIK